LVAPAGTNLLQGNPLDGADYHDETLPYAEAGFLSIQYSLDGAVYNEDDTAEMTKAYRQFRAAGAGTVNTRCVIEFVKQRLPEVDPRRIYVAGHSSAGTVSLLAAETFPNDVAACIAYAPCSDPEAFHADAPGFLLNTIFPGFRSLDQHYSPIRKADQLKCPLFLFQATDDSVVEAAETKKMAEAARKHNNQVTYSEVGFGDHYDSMIQQGIPKAISWLRTIDASRQH
ncbi:MAG: prolyl oligopeptidase family serine peptidase, partial [Planctomycetaceae bacterium]|nr:prolyl oligopeptidase family serine peptidase [Planctomycetaceae bacterium]